MKRFLLVFISLWLYSCSSSDTSSSHQELIEDNLLNPLPIDSLTEGDRLTYGPIVLEDSLKEEDTRLADMLLVKAEGGIVILGNSAPDANVNDRPAMTVNLDYDYFMSRHEVTCREFNDVMGSSTGIVLKCENDSLPVTNVTYYDAVLFANERSKAAGFDTAYTYLKWNLDAEKHCVSLEGFEYHPEAKAFHLPTEAEWVYAASKNWNPLLNAWTADNSDYKLHPVCSKAQDGEICDMAGNAMEWVNDWFGHFRDTTVTDYVGAPDGGSLAQRIVKGGSFRNQASLITLYGRSDVYTVTSSTRIDYVGFRLTFGNIPNAVWMGVNGRATSSKVTPLASMASVGSFTKAYKAKLVFRNDVSGNLAFVDYSNSVLSVVEIADTLEAYHPEISPDGIWVAFCTKLEGVDGKSDLYVRKLDADGSNLVRLDVESAAIPRWRVLENGDTAIVYVTSAGNNKNESAFKQASTWQVTFANGKLGTPQKLLDGAYHGGVSADNRLAVTGARLLRAFVDGSGESVWYSGEQACNASLSQDGLKETLFLDFASSTGKAFVGERYATHQRILVADSTGKLIRSVGAPLGFTFDHTEWVDGASGVAVATLVGSNGSHSEIVLVNLLDSSFVELAKGDELWHPDLWVKGNDIVPEDKLLDLDSAGIYMNPEDVMGAILMRYNMELLWRYRDTVNVAILGSSRPLNSLSPQVFSPEFFAVNFAHTPNSMYASRDYLERYLLNHLKRLKYVVISLDIDFWFKVDGVEGDNFFVQVYKSYPGYVYDENHDYWKEGYPEGLLECTENSISVADADIYLGDRGRFMATGCAMWPEEPELSLDSTFYDDKQYLLDDNLDALKYIIETSQKRGIYVVGMIFPQNPRYKDTGAFGRYGLRRSVAATLIEQFKALEKEYPNFVLFDENKMGDHDYSDGDAQDNDHLCGAAAPKITGRLDSLLKTLK